VTVSSNFTKTFVNKKPELGLIATEKFKDLAKPKLEIPTEIKEKVNECLDRSLNRMRMDFFNKLQSLQLDMTR